MGKLIKFTFVAIFLAVISFYPYSSSAMSLSVKVPEKYVEVEAGQRLYYEINIKYPENPKRIDLRLEYIITKDGKDITGAKVLKAIETQASFMDFIVIPESAKTGKYSISVIVSDYGSLREEVQADFQVIPNQAKKIAGYFFILLAAITLTIILGVVQIYIVKKKGQN